MGDPKISVIVPIYKVEPYLRKCLDSIVNQTYRNLEIILVDDGSPDKCGSICDEYAAKDSRIIVIHKENGGVSSARNAGVSEATGAWIGFVDADDWLEVDMFTYLIENAKDYDADITVCSHWEEQPYRSVACRVDTVRLLTGDEALELLLRDDVVNNYLWNKLWKRELFQNIVFPVGRSFEDVATAYRLFERATRVVCLPVCKYHYRQHGGSILDQQKLTNKMNFYFAAKERMVELQERYSQYEELLQASCISASVGIWAAYCFNDKAEQQRYAPLLQEIAGFSKKHQALVNQHMNLGPIGRVIAYLTAYDCMWAFIVAGALGRIYRIKHGRNI